MASQTATTLKRIIRSVAKADQPNVTDRELLLRFTGEDDQAAFAALFERHSDMVLGVCRRALPTVQDAEDAVQATFLVLIRVAKKVKWQPSLSNWLYVTARKIAHNARVSAQRRARREARVAGPEAVEPVDRMTGRELLAALDGELDKLPPSYREPLVLCFLEGLTGDEAAARLGIPAATLRTRINRGRKRLHDALTKSGCALGAGLLALAVTSAARTSSPQLIDAVLAAVSGTPPDAVAELAKGITVNGMRNKAVLAVAATIGVAALGMGLGWLTPSAVGQKADQPTPPALTNKQAKDTKPDTAIPKQVTVSGRVVGADGKPIVAELFANWIEAVPQPLGKTKADGTFEVTVPLKQLGGWLMAKADGHGMEFVRVSAQTPAEVTLQLPKDQPLRGRLIDPQGKPLAGLHVTVDSVTCYDNNSLDKHLKLWTTEIAGMGHPPGGDRSTWFRSNNPTNRESDSPISVKTDADGKFELTGVGAEQLFGLTVRGAGFALTRVSVMNRNGFDPKPYLEAAKETAMAIPVRRGRFSQLYGPDAQIIVEREKLIRGKVTKRDTGQPLAGVRILARNNDRGGYLVYSETLTDKDGKYEVSGLRKHDGYFVECRIEPATGYFSKMVEVSDTAGYEPITVDLECRKGIIVSGTIKDKATGKPLSARVWWEGIPGNPFVKIYPADDLKEELSSSSDGRFQFVTIPGPVMLVALLYKGKEGEIYRPAKPDPKYPDFFPRFADAKWCQAIETKETDREVHVEIELEPAPRMAVKVIDVDGKPVTGTYATGITQLDFDHAVHHPDTDTMTVFNVEPKQERFLAVVDAKRRLVGTAVVKENDKDPVVKLGPGGFVTGRLVDAKGKPLGGLTVGLYYTRREVGEVSEPLNEEQASVLRVGRRETTTDADGEFRLDALFLGQEFRLGFQKGNKRFGPEYNKAPRHAIEKPGDTLKLGDVKVEPQEINGPE